MRTFFFCSTAASGAASVLMKREEEVEIALALNEAMLKRPAGAKAAVGRATCDENTIAAKDKAIIDPAVNFISLPADDVMFRTCG